MNISVRNLGFLRLMKNLSDSRFIVDVDIVIGHLTTSGAGTVFSDFRECVMDLKAFDYIRPVLDNIQECGTMPGNKFQLTLKSLWILYWSNCREQNRMV